MRTLDEIRAFLRAASRINVLPDADVVAAEIDAHKEAAIRSQDESIANLCWCLLRILAIHTEYRRAFDLMVKQDYAEAWQSFAIVEDSFDALWRHWDCTSNEYMLTIVKQQTERFKFLFQYRWFPSPEILLKGKRCSICGKTVSLRNSCGHRDGDLYWGELCRHTIIGEQILAVAMVENPRQRHIPPLLLHDPAYPDGGTEKQHELIVRLLPKLQNAFTPWSYTKTTKRQPHEQFRSVGVNGSCPCESGKKYKKCCLPHPDGVLMPHLVFHLDGQQATELLDYSSAQLTGGRPSSSQSAIL